MDRKILVVAIGISFLLVIPVMSITVVNAAVATGLEGAYWQGSFFGTPAPTWPTCPPGFPASNAAPIPPPAGVPSSTPPTVTETDPMINFGSTTGFYWDESTSTSTPGNPGGFAVTQGGYGIAGLSWGDKNLYTDYPASTYFVNTDFSVEWTGYIHLNAETTYYFQLESDDGSMLYINPTPGSSTISSADTMINNWFIEPPTTATSAAFRPSVTGYYAIEVDFFETCDSQSGIDLLWSTTSATSGFAIIPTDAFTPASLGSNAPVTPPTVPEFGAAVPAVAAISLLAMALLRKTVTGRIGTKT